MTDRDEIKALRSEVAALRQELTMLRAEVLAVRSFPVLPQPYTPALPSPYFPVGPVRTPGWYEITCSRPHTEC